MQRYTENPDLQRLQKRVEVPVAEPQQTGASMMARAALPATALAAGVSLCPW